MVDIYTGDRDLLQLINSDVELKQLIGFFHTLYFVRNDKNEIKLTKTNYTSKYDSANHYSEINNLVVKSMTERRSV